MNELKCCLSTFTIIVLGPLGDFIYVKFFKGEEKRDL